MTRAMLAALAMLCGAIMGCLSAAPAQAQTCSATVSSIDFGDAALLSTSPTDVTGTLSVTCTSIPLLSVVKFCPSIGAGSGGSDAASRLLTGPSVLHYQLYQDAARTSAWGSLDNPALGTVPAIILSGSILGAGTTTRTVYGRLLGGQQSATPGSYRSDFAGNSTMFTYAPALIGASSSCTGFVGSTLRPTFSVTATPPRTCTVTATALNFPVTGVLSAAVISDSRITVTCTSTTAYSVQLDPGKNADGAGGRRMKAATGGLVGYGLFRDTARTVAWGSGGQAVTGTGTGSAQQLTVYGRVPAQATPAPGTYSDTVVVTVTY